MNAVTPLLFEPIGREKLWGGAYLARTMRKPFALDAKIGESWEVSDYPGAETRVANGPSAGTSLRRLVEERLEEIVGDEAVLQDGRFPLLVKYIDAKETLSVQVHPGDDYAREHEGGFGKQEAWYVVHAEPGAKLIRGVAPGTDRETFARALERGELDPCLHAFEPNPGDLILIPWGMLHAIGAGIVLAEIQQTSDLTYRVYDWNRVDDGGRSRELHVEKALDVIAFEPPRRDTCRRKLLADGPARRYEGVRCDKFVVEVLELSGVVEDAPPPGRFVILNVVAGEARLAWDGGELPLPFGGTALIPAAMDRFRLAGDPATVLRSTVP